MKVVSDLMEKKLFFTLIQKGLTRRKINIENTRKHDLFEGNIPNKI